MRADDRCAGRTPSHCAAARAAPTLNLRRGGGERRAGGGAVNKLRAGPCPRAQSPSTTCATYRSNLADLII